MILLTRPLVDSKRLQEQLKERGVESVISPMIAVDFMPVGWADIDIGTVQAVVLTSKNAVRALAADTGMPALTHLPCYCVGERTAEKARSYGFSSISVGAGDAEGLIALLERNCDPSKGALLYLSAAKISVPLDERLREIGFAVIRKVVYQAMPKAEFTPSFWRAYEGGDLQAAAFYSARTAQNFAQIAERHGISDHLHSIKALCISAGVIKYVQHLNWRSTEIARAPTGAAMLDLIVRHTKQEHSA